MGSCAPLGFVCVAGRASRVRLDAPGSRFPSSSAQVERGHRWRLRSPTPGRSPQSSGCVARARQLGGFHLLCLQPVPGSGTEGSVRGRIRNCALTFDGTPVLLARSSVAKVRALVPVSQGSRIPSRIPAPTWVSSSVSAGALASLRGRVSRLSSCASVPWLARSQLQRILPGL